jgi:Cys-rich four helix bundle protein (predicted Tat secretion target)
MSKDAEQLLQESVHTAAATRRDALNQVALMLGAGLTGATLAPSLTRAQSNDHSGHMDHGGHMGAATGPAPHQALIDAATLCINRGEVCLNHCMSLLGTGDTSMKECIRTVTAMLATSAALVRFAASDSPRLKELTKLCNDICDDCEKECRKHEQHHVVCKNCAEACAGAIAEGKKLLGA